MPGESPYGGNRNKPANAIVGRIQKIQGMPFASEDDSFSKMNIGDVLSENNPYIIERDMQDVPVSAAKCCLNGDDPRGFVSVKKDGLRPTYGGYPGEK